MRTLGRLIAVVALIGALTQTVRAAGPAERAKARETFRAAQQHYKLAEYEKALEAFKETYRLVEDPSLLFNIAQCYRQLNRKEEAIRFYRTYLHDSQDSDNRESVQQIIASLEKAIREENAARTAPPESTIEPGQSLPAPPRPAVAPGASAVVVAAPPRARPPL